ncbi:MAG: DUF58 domain-containing protein [Nakamurella sp.]
MTQVDAPSQRRSIRRQLRQVLTRRRQRFGSWRRTAAWYRAPGVICLAVGLGLATGRADLVILAAPLSLGWVAALMATRPMLGSRAPSATSRVDVETFGSNSADVITEVIGTDGVEFVSVAQPGIGSGPIGEMVTLPGGAPSRTARSQFRTTQWGWTPVTRPDSLGAGPDGLYVTGQVRYAPARGELILPAVSAVPAIGLPSIIGGWAGAHVSRRPGQGSDLVDLREFAPGDRLRQVHWRAYARHQRLYTRRTLSDAEAELMICLDLSTLYRPRLRTPAVGAWAVAIASAQRLVVQVTDEVSAWRDPKDHAATLETRRHMDKSSLDHTVAAVAAFASAHLQQGDRVGMLTATIPQHVVRPGTGDRQLQRIRHRLALTEDRRSRMLPVPLWRLTPGQIVVWCSPMTTEQSFRAVAECAARGHLVVVVDTLPVAGMLARLTAAEADHWRVLAVERERELTRLRGRGIGVIHWDEGGIEGQLVDVRRVLRGRRH